MNNPCDVKTLYDTQFEAELAASRASFDFKAEMVAYQCGSHWHIANKLKENRSKNRKHHQTWCEACQVYLKAGNWERHQTRSGHQRNAYQLDLGSKVGEKDENANNDCQHGS